MPVGEKFIHTGFPRFSSCKSRLRRVSAKIRAKNFKEWISLSLHDFWTEKEMVKRFPSWIPAEWSGGSGQQWRGRASGKRNTMTERVRAPPRNVPSGLKTNTGLVKNPDYLAKGNKGDSGVKYS